MKNSKRFQFILKFTKPYKITFLTLFICIITTSFIGMLYPYVFGLLIDEVFYHKNVNFFKVIVVGYCILYLGEQLLHLVLNYVAAYFATRFNFDIRRKLYEKILKLKAGYLNDIRTGDLITIINSDSEQIYEFIHWNVFYLIANALRLLISIIFVGLINLKLMLLMIVVVPISVYASRYFGKLVKERTKLYRDQYGKYISWVFEILKGMREVQLFGVERHVTKYFVRQCASMVRLKNRTNLTEFASDSTNGFISLLSDLSVYVLASLLIVNGQLTVGAFVASIDYFMRANLLLKSLNDANMKIQNQTASIDKVVELLIQEEEGSEPHKGKLNPAGGRIQFSGVNFRYDGCNDVLKNISFAVNAGERISLVGRSGAGKSTVANLLLRFYEPETGIITIDDQDISKVTLESLRRSIGVVQQENLIFQGTIRHNVLLGNPKANDTEIWNALQKADIADFVKELPEGLETIIGSNGIELSGGQRQRITIARIFLKNPKILIFDEATSSLDYETEQAVHQAGIALSMGRTVITIAHRLSTILDSDRVAVLKDGEIIAFDHHLSLLKECGYYGELFKDQYMSSLNNSSVQEAAAI